MNVVRVKTGVSCALTTVEEWQSGPFCPTIFTFVCFDQAIATVGKMKHFDIPEPQGMGKHGVS